jgi:hypothetical protein
MTTKEKYELIDKTKVSAKVLEILEKMEKASSNFTNAEVNSRVDTALDKIIEGLKVSKPEALLSVSDAKKEVKKEKKEAEEKNKGKDLSKKKDTDDKTGLPKKDTVEERKDIIKKESESEKEARERAKKELEKENEKAKDAIESQIEKLNRIILEDPALRGFNTGTSATGGGKSTPLIDAERKAIARGRRVSQKGRKNQYGASAGGRVYWENRENRSDRKSPDYPTGKPYLEKGGNVYASEDLYEVKMVQDGVELDSKLIRARNKGEARMIFEDMYQEKYQDEFGAFDLEIDIAKDRMADGGGIPYKPYGKTKGRFTLKYEDDGEQQSEIWSSLEEATNSARRYVNPKLGYTNVQIYDESGKEYFFADGGMMADGGVIGNGKNGYVAFYKGKKIEVYADTMYGAQKIASKHFKAKNEWEVNVVLAEVDGKPYVQSTAFAKGGMMADGGEVDFNERMAKMRNAYDNLEMIVKGKIASAIGIDEAIAIMGTDYSIDPFRLIIGAVRGGLLELDEINKDLVNEAVYEAERVTDDYRDSGQGIGGSDMTYFTQNVLNSAGYKTGFINNTLKRVDADGNELVIDKYEMKF